MLRDNREEGGGLPRVRLYATLKKAAGFRETEIEAGTVEELLEHLSVLCEGRLERYLESGIVLVNNRNISSMQGKATPLRPGDTVSVYPPVAGG